MVRVVDILERNFEQTIKTTHLASGAMRYQWKLWSGVSSNHLRLPTMTTFDTVAAFARGANTDTIFSCCRGTYSTRRCPPVPLFRQHLQAGLRLRLLPPIDCRWRAALRHRPGKLRR